MGKSRNNEVARNLCDLHVSLSSFRVQHEMNQLGIYGRKEMFSHGIALNLEVMLDAHTKAVLKLLPATGTLMASRVKSISARTPTSAEKQHLHMNST